jgi:tetratricopeptide (TPR) repeat protein
LERLRARALAANRAWDAAIAALEGLFGAQPERLDIGLDLVGTLLACGRTDAADTALGRLRQLARDDDAPRVGLRIDLIEAEVALQLSEFQRAAAAASRARELAARIHAVVPGQRAARVHAEAIGRLDRREEARRELTAIAARNLALHLTRETAAARLALGPILTRVASSEETRRTLEAALAGCIQSGDRRGEVLARAQLALVAGKEGKLAEAIRAADAALADARAIGDRWSEGYVLAQRLTLYNWAHDEAATFAAIEPTLAALRESGNRRLLMGMLSNAAIPAIEALDLEKAEAYIVEAEGLAHRVGSQVGSAYVDGTRAYLERTRGDLDLARKSYASAIEKGRRAGVPSVVADYVSELAWLELEAGRPAEGAQYAQEAIAQFNALGDTRMALKTEGVLACSDARRGDSAGATRRLTKLRKGAAEDGSEHARFNLLAIEARVAEASGDWRRAIELRRQTVRMAVAWKAPGLVIEQQTWLAKALQGAGERRELEKLVAQLLPECERRGLRGIARDLRALVAS